MSKWTAIVDREASGDSRGLNSPFDLRASNSKSIVTDASSGVPQTEKITLPTATLTGSVYREPMCLIQMSSGQRTAETG